MNDTLGPEWLVPSTLVFGESPKVVIPSEEVSVGHSREGRALISNTARKEMGKHMYSLRIRRALQQKTTQSANRTYKLVKIVLVCREKIINNRIGEWLGLFKVIDVDEYRNLIYTKGVKIGVARLLLNIAQVKHYLQPEHPSHCFISALGKRFGKCGTKYAEKEDMQLTEMVHQTDPRAHFEEMTDAKRKRIKNIL